MEKHFKTVFLSKMLETFFDQKSNVEFFVTKYNPKIHTHSKIRD